MSKQLTGTVAIVTGASSGIGHATAIELAGRGASVALVARRKDGVAAFPADKQALAADGIAYVVTRSRHASVGELWLIPTDQV